MFKDIGNWVLTGFIGRLMLFSLPFLVMFFAWQLVTEGGWIAPLFLPKPSDVVAQFISLLSSNEIVEPLLISLYRAAVGLMLALVLGVLIGLLMARNQWVAWFGNPLVSLGFPAPKIVLIPLFILYFGIGDISKVLLITLTCIFPIIIIVQQAASSMNRSIIWSAQSMATTEQALLWRIAFPAITPAVFTSVRIAMPAALITTFTCEMVAGGGGLGAALMYAQRFFETPTVYVYIVVMLLIGIALDRLLLVMQSWLIPWQDKRSY